MLVHFPIALALVALLFNLGAYFFKNEWLNKSTVILVILAALGAIAAILSGFFFTKPTAGLATVLKDQHVMYALISTVILVLASFIGLISLSKGGRRNSWLGYIFTLVMLFAAAGILLTGMKGGSIVYDVWLF